MPSVIRRRSWYALIYRDGRQKWIKLPKSIKTKNQAIKAAVEIEDQMRRQLLGLPHSNASSAGPEFFSVVEPILARVEQQQHRDTFSGWNSLMCNFTRLLGNRPIGQYTLTDIEHYRDWRLARGASASTARRELTKLSAVFRRAIDIGHISENPCKKVQRPVVAPKPTRWLSLDEVRRFLDHCLDNWRLPFSFLLFTGARPGEAYRCTWNDIDLERGTILIRSTKNQKADQANWRSVPIMPQLRELLEAIPEKDRRGGALFHTRYNWRRAFKATCRRAGIPEAPPYICRHTFASHLAMAGEPLQVIRDLLGHRSVKTTETFYAHLAPSRYATAIANLGRTYATEKGKAKVIEL